jgi:hypothetical protein
MNCIDYAMDFVCIQVWRNFMYRLYFSDFSEEYRVVSQFFKTSQIRVLNGMSLNYASAA